MILESRFAPSVSTRSMFVIALSRFSSCPRSSQTTKTDARAGSNDAAPATPAGKPDTPTTSEFPYVVKFEQGATRFSNGDKITILEVRGTADTFEPGNIYWIKGTYTLASHERAMLAAFTTAMDSDDGTGLPSKSRRPSSIRATVRSRSSYRCRAGVGRTSASIRPTAEEISAATISGRAIPC